MTTLPSFIAYGTLVFMCDTRAKVPEIYVYDFYLFAIASKSTIYEIYKRENIAQIVIKNVRRTRELKGKQTKEAEAKVIEDAIIMVDKLIKHE